MKMTTVVMGLVLCLTIAAATPSHGIIGRIAATVHGRINVASGDRAVVTLGNNAGIIKGDILKVVTNMDQGISNPLGSCPVIEVRENSSICEIMNARTEIDRGCRVVAKDLQAGDPRLFPYLFRMMADSVEPYAPYAPVRMHIHTIYDSMNNVTALSQRLTDEIYKLFSQKQRITIKSVYREGDLRLYPKRLKDNYQTAKYFMEKTDTDIVLTGLYRIQGDTALVTLYAIDRTYGERQSSFSVKLDGLSEMAEATTIVTPYDPAEVDEYVPCRIEFVEKPYVPHKDEKKQIIAYEAGDNAFKAHELKRTAFTTMSPVNISVHLDKEKVDFGSRNDTVLLIQKGLHRLSASFRRGYFMNAKESLLFTSDKEVTRDALLHISKGGVVVVRIALSPAIQQSGIEISVFREADHEKTVLRPITTVEAGRVVDYYKD